MKIFLAAVLGFISVGCVMCQEKTLEKEQLCYVIRFAEPFIKKEYGVEYKKKFQLLDVCPKREPGLQYPGAYIPIERDGKTISTQFDVLKTFTGEQEARQFAEKNTLTDTPFLPKNDCEIIRIIDFPLTKRPNAPKNPRIALLNTCLFDEIDVQRPSIDVLRLGKKQTRLFEVLKPFETKRAAEQYVKDNKLFDVNYNDDSELGEIDLEITKAFLNTMRGEITDEVVKSDKEFKAKLKKELANPKTLDYPFFNLSNEITIQTSPDQKLRFYSWDNRSGGTWHQMTVIAQYKDNKGIVHINELNDPHLDELPQSTDIIIYKIYEIKVKNRTQYLTFSWGTHGGGQQFNLVKVFRIQDTWLLEDSAILPDGRDISIYLSRGAKSDLLFNSETNEISYNEFIEDKDSGFMKATGKTIKLKLINEKFKSQ